VSEERSKGRGTMVDRAGREREKEEEDDDDDDD
jgi:hypothetical protein